MFIPLEKFSSSGEIAVILGLVLHYVPSQLKCMANGILFKRSGITRNCFNISKWIERVCTIAQFVSGCVVAMNHFDKIAQLQVFEWPFTFHFI